MVATRDRILEAAHGVMHKLGLSSATTKQIARAADLSEAALYKHFTDKDELFLHVLQDRVPQMVDALKVLHEQVGRASVEANLEAATQATLAYYVEALPMIAALFAQPTLLGTYRETLRKENRGPQRAVELLADYLRAEQRLKRVSAQATPDAVAKLLLGACFQQAFLRVFWGETLTPAAARTLSRALVRSLMTGLAP
jgi:AcrR family transcriptional regulator